VSTLPAIHSKTRRSSRLNQAIALTVQGADASRTPFLEHVSTMTVSCHGCKYRAKNKVALGDLVLLAIENAERQSVSQSRARVKQVLQLAANENPFEVVLELETPGNIWAVPTPPEDWFPVREAAASETASSGIRVLPRNEAQIAQSAAGPAPALAERAEANGSPNQFLAQFMVGLNEQIRVIAADAATAAMAKEKGRLLDEFRGQLQDEARKTLEQAIVVARDGAGSRVLQELNAAHETASRSTYERWTKKIEQDFAETAQRSVSLGSKVNERVEKAAVVIVERVQQNLDASRREGVDQFRARLRTEVTPLLEEAQAAIQKLAAFQEEVKVRSLEICGQFGDFLKEEALRSADDARQRIAESDQQFAGTLKDRVAKGSEELETKSAEVAGAFADNLRKLSLECEQGAQERLKTLAEYNADHAANLMKEKIVELSSQFSNEMENYRNYLQLISTSIGEIAKRPAVRMQE
jgi:hypothetical protein